MPEWSTLLSQTKVDLKPTAKDIGSIYMSRQLKWARVLFGVQMKPERMPDKNYPKTVAYQERINNLTENKGVHERLGAYLSQGWTLLYTPEEQLVWKTETKAGTQQDSFVHFFTQMCYIFILWNLFIVCTSETYIEKLSRGFFGSQLETKRSSKKILKDDHLEIYG